MRLYNKTTELTSRLNKSMDTYKHYNCFNPSQLILDNKIIIAFRSYYPNKTKPFSAYLLIIEHKKQLLINLTEKFLPYTRMPTCDPKLFIHNKEVWVTFNTGHFEHPNRIFIARVYPEVEEPIECVYKNRSAIEKNWGFFTLKERLCCVYSLRPTVILEANYIKKFTNSILFTESNNVRRTENTSTNITLGTQPILFHDDSLLMIAHQKYYLSKKRLYVGTPVKIEFNTNKVSTTFSTIKLFHSFSSLLGNKKKHNPNLISCTYFSGLEKIKEDIILGYGINDLAYNFSRLNIKELQL